MNLKLYKQREQLLLKGNCSILNKLIFHPQSSDKKLEFDFIVE